MIDVRLRSRIPQEELDAKVGKILTDEDYNVLLTRAARVRQPDGRLLCVYLPGALLAEADEYWDMFSRIRGATDNRGHASGAVRVKAGTTRTRSKLIYSSILGSFDQLPSKPYCRLTAFTAKEGEKWNGMQPFFAAMGKLFKENVPDRFERQMQEVRSTEPDWVVPGTPFTTITVNNSYPTGVHTDKGDLDEGFSSLAVMRKGSYEGGYLTFPEFRVAVNLKHGDMILMDAHQWHGNTRMVCACGKDVVRPCKECGAERVSIVAYYRTQLTTCGTLEQEEQKRLAARETSLT